LKCQFYEENSAQKVHEILLLLSPVDDFFVEKMYFFVHIIVLDNHQLNYNYGLYFSSTKITVQISTNTTTWSECHFFSLLNCNKINTGKIFEKLV